LQDHRDAEAKIRRARESMAADSNAQLSRIAVVKKALLLSRAPSRQECRRAN
jgi:hypothetical protein